MDIRRGVFLPNLITMGNGVCGFAALVKIMKINVVVSPTTGLLEFDQPRLFGMAAWLILAGMLFDVFDGKLARLSGRTSDLGAQLDSLCDLTTFGLAPAALVVRLNMIYDPMWQYFAWFFALAYFLGALLRLARFNAENAHDESAHMCFKGLPSPAAAGCVASLVIFHRYIYDFNDRKLSWLAQYVVSQETIQAAFLWIPFALAFLALFLGYTMVSSRLKYVHVATRIFRRQSFEFLVSLIFGAILAWLFREIVLPVVFIGYLFYTPISTLVRKFRRRGDGPPSDEREPDGGRDLDEFLQEPPVERRRV
jgi:CDP-diacylglycerol---serine O-phosphatidyltransferase